MKKSLILLGLLLGLNEYAVSMEIDRRPSILTINSSMTADQRNEEIAIFLRNNRDGDMQIEKEIQSGSLQKFSVDDMKEIVRRSVALHNANFVTKVFSLSLNREYWPIQFDMSELYELYESSYAIATSSGVPLLSRKRNDKILAILEKKLYSLQQIIERSEKLNLLNMYNLIQLYKDTKAERNFFILSFKAMSHLGEIEQSVLHQIKQRSEPGYAKKLQKQQFTDAEKERIFAADLDLLNSFGATIDQSNIAQIIGILDNVSRHNFDGMLTLLLEKYGNQLVTCFKRSDFVYKCAENNNIHLIQMILDSSHSMSADMREISIVKLINAIQTDFNNNLILIQQMQERGFLPRLSTEEVWPVLENAAVNNYKVLIEGILNSRADDLLFPYIPCVDKLQKIRIQVDAIGPYEMALHESRRKKIIASLSSGGGINLRKSVSFNDNTDVLEYELTAQEKSQKQASGIEVKDAQRRNLRERTACKKKAKKSGVKDWWHLEQESDSESCSDSDNDDD